MNFDIKTEQLSDDAYVISLAGEVDLYTAPEFKQQLLEVIGQGGKQVIVDFSNDDVHRLDDARRARRRRQAPAHERRPALARLQRPQHHEDLRDHRARPRLRDLRDARRGGLEARRRLPTVRRRPCRTRSHSLAGLCSSRSPRRAAARSDASRPGDAEPRQAALPRTPKAQCALVPHARRREVARGRSARTSTTRSRPTRRRASRSRRSATSSAARSPTPRSRCRRTSYRGPGRRRRRGLRREVRRQPDLRRHGARTTAGAADDDDDRRRTAGGGAKPDGKQVFASAGCGGCHTLKDAGSSGQRRPEPRPAEAVGGGRSRTRSRSAAARCRRSRAADRRADPGRRRSTSQRRRQVARAVSDTFGSDQSRFPSTTYGG